MNKIQKKILWLPLLIVLCAMPILFTSCRMAENGFLVSTDRWTDAFRSAARAQELVAFAISTYFNNPNSSGFVGTESEAIARLDDLCSILQNRTLWSIYSNIAAIPTNTSFRMFMNTGEGTSDVYSKYITLPR
ncbi:MAG: hypothetical protein LBT01_04955 [Spirochaetaceae bacterium]|nr:hypothetical protein [Spirochaetaceae bacterium]